MSNVYHQKYQVRDHVPMTGHECQVWDTFCEYDQGGMDITILWGTGGVCSHVGIFLWDCSTLYFVESNAPDINRYEATEYFKNVAKRGTYNLSALC